MLVQYVNPVRQVIDLNRFAKTGMDDRPSAAEELKVCRLTEMQCARLVADAR